MSYHLDIRTDDAGPPADLLAVEWLQTSGTGGFAGASVLGCCTRKYHGLLVAAANPPAGRAVLWSAMRDELVVGDRTIPLACFEFDGAFHPRGDRHLAAFDVDDDGVAHYTFRIDGLTVVRSIVLARLAEAVTVRWSVRGDLSPDAFIRIQPFFAYRHYHHLRQADRPCVRAAQENDTVHLADAAGVLPPMRFHVGRSRFVESPDWWRRFRYRAECERGDACFEDLFSPGMIDLSLTGGVAELAAAAMPDAPMSFDEAVISRSEHRRELVRQARVSGQGAKPSPATPAMNPKPCTPSPALLFAADDFIVRVPHADPTTRGHESATSPVAGGIPATSSSLWTVIAGYPWFADWGRDTFISLPGLLLDTGRCDIAHRVLLRFARAIRNGLVPNRFTDDPRGSQPADYNSADAGLWFIQAAFAWADCSGEWDGFDLDLAGPVRDILNHYHAGTEFNIHVDPADGLLVSGHPGIQVTWMDAMFNGVAITPRAGKPVEINALYGDALRRIAARLADREPKAAKLYSDRYNQWRDSFVEKFLSSRGGLIDRIDENGQPDELIRPNQLFAVSLGQSPLPVEVQKQVVQVAQDVLLTPVGLRSLAPGEPGYHGRYEGDLCARDGAYHQGTVWGWLIGPFLEAYLRVNKFSKKSRIQAGQWLDGMEAHMQQAGLGQISEIFDADPPHTPRGCPAQAWSVAEVVRIRALITRHPQGVLL